jgi:hypothetical protein
LGITEDARVRRTSASDCHNTRGLPVIEESRENSVLASEGLWLGDPGKCKAVPLI